MPAASPHSLIGLCDPHELTLQTWAQGCHALGYPTTVLTLTDLLQAGSPLPARRLIGHYPWYPLLWRVGPRSLPGQTWYLPPRVDCITLTLAQSWGWQVLATDLTWSAIAAHLRQPTRDVSPPCRCLRECSLTQCLLLAGMSEGWSVQALAAQWQVSVGRLYQQQARLRAQFEVTSNAELLAQLHQCGGQTHVTD